ncbi:YicC/YloC family endoribonuclease [Occallatibacter riparius]|uniref:YicC family protein n=1 Tax=Occallatibacter riparius TaxID=1002689 RepID=A0A9J7BJR7_9BACT|nr:YicC/YloC family endoribonuclease [Occallatibacter riparius]UWZ82705.1 YicC family protein [Occallatibacter riparius]
MPLYSMTGYARVQVSVPIGEQAQLGYTLSLKSVNHRFLDIQLRLPSGLDELEMELRRALKENLVRGHVDLTLSIERSAQTAAGYNREFVANYIAAFAAAREEHALTGQPDLNAILRLPGALQADSRSNSDQDLAPLTESVKNEIGPLLQQLKAMRAREGESLEAILHASLDRLTEAVAGVAQLRPEVDQRYQERLTQRLTTAVGNEFNRQRLLEEVAVLVDRSDIAEELARMNTHIGHFRELLSAGGEVGKKLDFLLQEMNREANTLLSKTGGVGGKGTKITELGLAMKAEIEKAREQIQNVE